jgi:hypothetical protein
MKCKFCDFEMEDASAYPADYTNHLLEHILAQIIESRVDHEVAEQESRPKAKQQVSRYRKGRPMWPW